MLRASGTLPLIVAAMLLCGLLSCIGDDFIDDLTEESLQITNAIDSLAVGDTYQFRARYMNNLGREEQRTIVWSSSDEEVLTIDAAGLATGIAFGSAVISAETSANGSVLKAEFPIGVGNSTSLPRSSRSGRLTSTSSYKLKGTFELVIEGSLILRLSDDYEASSALPGLYVYLSNNRNSIGNAYEIGEVKVFSGAHEYQILDAVGINDYNYVLYYCKPFGVKVGHGEFDD